MIRRRRRSQRDPQSAKALAELLKTTDRMMTKWSSKIRIGHDWEVLADGLEQYGHPRIAKELRESIAQRKRMTHEQKVDDSFWNAGARKRWNILYREIVKAIRQVQVSRQQKQYDYKANRLGYDEYMVSSQEASKLLREVGRSLSDFRVRSGYHSQDYYVELPSGEKAWLGRRSRAKYEGAFQKYNVTPPKRDWFYVVTIHQKYSGP